FIRAEDGIRVRVVTRVQMCTLAISIHGKSFKGVADRFHTSTSTVIRRFDTINADMLKEPKQLPSVIAIDEYKGDAGAERYQPIIADPVDRRPLDILADSRKLLVKKY